MLLQISFPFFRDYVNDFLNSSHVKTSLFVICYPFTWFSSLLLYEIWQTFSITFLL